MTTNNKENITTEHNEDWEEEEINEIDYSTQSSATITEKRITVKEILEDFKDTVENGTTAYKGKLNIRPAYQREFVYKGEQREAVIKTILSGLPLSAMYWAKDKAGNYEVMDGQQRTLSILKFITEDENVVTLEGETGNIQKTYENLSQADRDAILNYELDIKVFEGTFEEKLKWFKTINTVGEQLNDQELLNAVYTGPFVNDARAAFSNINSAIYKKDVAFLVKGDPLRQDTLAKVLKWVSKEKGITVEQYMSDHRQKDASHLKGEANKILAWVKTVFMPSVEHVKDWFTGIEWGDLYYANIKREIPLDASHIDEIAETINKFEQMVDFQNNKGEGDPSKMKSVISYIIYEDERKLKGRTFDKWVIIQKIKTQEGKCAHCEKSHNDKGEKLTLEADHIIPWSKGGLSTEDNLQMLCMACNRKKSNKSETEEEEDGNKDN